MIESPSQLVVENLATWNPNDDGINLITKILPVLYNDVTDSVEELWTNHNPDLIIHVGVHAMTKSVLIESQSFNFGYCRQDVASKVPFKNCCVPTSSSPELRSKLNIPALVESVNKANCDCDIKIKQSNDPGRYLCGFSYYLSLNKDPVRALFIHIPPLNNEATTVEKLTDILKVIITQALKQIP